MIVAGRTMTLVLLAATAGLAALPLVADPYYLQLVSTMLVTAMFALSLQLLVGGTGLVSLAHGAFFGVGAYTVQLMAVFGPAPSILLTLPAAALLAGLAALAVGSLALRTNGFFFLMTTLAFGQMLFFLYHDTPLGGGADGVFITRPALSAFGFEYAIGRRDRPTAMLLLNLAILVAMYAGLAGLLRTLFGRALLGIRANENRMRSMGFHTYGLKLAAFTAAGALAGVAGHMWAMTEAFVTPELLGWHRSVEGLLAILLGGLGTLHGPIVGGFLYIGLAEVAQSITERQHLVQGLVILLVVLVLPRGLSGLRLPARRQADPVATKPQDRPA